MKVVPKLDESGQMVMDKVKLTCFGEYLSQTMHCNVESYKKLNETCQCFCKGTSAMWQLGALIFSPTEYVYMTHAA